jgi:hypothetical protein
VIWVTRGLLCTEPIGVGVRPLRFSYINGDEIIVDGGFTRTIVNLVPRPGHD